VRKRGLADARDVFHQQVATGQQAGECLADGLVFADQHGIDLRNRRIEALARRGFGRCRTGLRDVLIHAHS
jgi:hypothetical protein